MRSGRSSRGMRAAPRAAFGIALTVALVLIAPLPASAGTKSLAVDASGADGVGRIDRPGRPCSEPGGIGAAWHYKYETGLPGTVLSSATGPPANLRMHLNLHSQASGAPQAVYTNAFLLGSESQAAFSNPRGIVRVNLKSGSGTCATPNLAFNGTTASGTGAWDIARGTGSFRDVTGSGLFSLIQADVAPGADNPWRIQLGGLLTVPNPDLKVEVLQTYWGFLGADYLVRKVTVVYRITNVGAGDAYGVRLVGASSPTLGVQALGPVPQKLGDLFGDVDGAGPKTGDSEVIRVRYQLGVLQPCNAVLIGCEFDTRLSVEMPDAFDIPANYAQVTHARAPDFPPPL